MAGHRQQIHAIAIAAGLLRRSVERGFPRHGALVLARADTGKPGDSLPVDGIAAVRRSGRAVPVSAGLSRDAALQPGGAAGGGISLRPAEIPDRAETRRAVEG